MHERTDVSTATDRPGQNGALVLFTAVAAVLGALGLAFGFVAVVVAAADDDGTSVGAAAEPMTVEVSLTEFAVTPASVDVAPGTELTLVVTNDGAMVHDLKLDGENGSRMLDPGEVQTVELGPIDESAEAWCTVPGHREAGMVLAVNVSGSGEATTAGTPSSATIDFAAEPSVDWQPYDPTLQPAPGGTEHQVAFEVTEQVMEVAPGVTQTMWTFDGTVPGPVLRGKVGDVFTVTLTNGGAVDHSIDFHASHVAWNDEMRSIGPGESLVYQFRAEQSGVFMYHCGTPPALHHIGNGMYGAVVIDPPDLAPVDHEYVLVQSELYLGPEGGVGDLAKMQATDFDAVVFNGYVDQYKHSPIQVEPNDRIRVWDLDAGPSENSAFHIVGTVFDTVYKEGAYVLRPDALSGGAQALDLQPSQGGFVEFTFAEPGLYPIVTHKFANVGRGALGLFQAGDGDPAAAGEH